MLRTFKTSHKLSHAFNHLLFYLQTQEGAEQPPGHSAPSFIFYKI